MSFIAAAIGVGGALIGGSIAAGGARDAASTQAGYERSALEQQKGMFNTVQGNEQPFMKAGQGAVSQLNYLLGTGKPGDPYGPYGATADSSSAGGYGSLNAPFTADTFKSMSPAYQFQAQQGAQGVLNQDASAQGAESGASLKDLMSFNQNFANTSFNNAFNQNLAQKNSIFDRLSQIATLGSNAGSNSATGASNFATSIGNTQAGIGAALGAGQVGVANSISGGLQSAAPWLQSVFSGGGGGPGYQGGGGGPGFIYNGVTQNNGQGGSMGNLVGEF